MPPQLALSICFLFIGYLFWLDFKKKDRPSHELWIPWIWMFLSGSRPVSSWLNMTPGKLEAYQEGSPIDAAVFALLIVGALFVLSKRNINWGRLFSQNKWIWFYFLYCGVSITWSDFPFVSFKRLIKELGNPIMVLVILTDRRPVEAIDRILKRLAVVWLPLSIVFFKYFPALGRQFHENTGEMFASGVGQQKNSLGIMCLICGTYFSWKYIIQHKENFKLNWQESIYDFALMGLTAWLLLLSKSATALACLVFVVVLVFVCRMRFVAQKPESVIMWLISGSLLFFFLDVTFDVRLIIYELLGRDATLTTRVSIWELLRNMVTNPILGEGYQSFWLGERLQTIWGLVGRTINQAHNGYLEQYLNLGYVGVSLLIAVILSGLAKVRRQLRVNYSAAVLCLCYIVVAVLYNYTEALFYGPGNIWLLTLFGAIEVPSQNSLKKNNIGG